MVVPGAPLTEDRAGCQELASQGLANRATILQRVQSGGRDLRVALYPYTPRQGSILRHRTSARTTLRAFGGALIVSDPDFGGPNGKVTTHGYESPTIVAHGCILPIQQR